jgi:hypothetical protein
MEPPSPHPSGPLPGWLFAAVLALVIGALLLARGGFTGGTDAGARVFITEFQALNRGGLRDKDGAASGWIELWNASGTNVNLGGWFLTDSFRSLKKWRFPERILAPGEHLLVFASGKDRREPFGELHTNFKLNDQGEYLALVKPDGASVVHEFLPRYPRQRPGVSYGLKPTFLASARGRPDWDDQAFFRTPTPGAANGEPLAGIVADTKFSHDRGLYSAPFTVKIETATPGARVFYTTDGSTPSETNGQPFTTAIRLERTTVLRAAAFKPGWVPSETDTQTYIFLDDVLRQTGAGFPPHWGHTNGQPVLADYEMDPEIVSDSAYRKTLIEGLKSLPTLSLVTDSENLFDADRGIYANPREKGATWERPASAELIFPDGRLGFQLNCGLRIQGGWNRRPEECPKHSLRLLFRKEYSVDRLKFPLFDGEGPQEWQTLTLRGGCNNTWLHWSGEERRRGDYIRDQWMRDTAAAMGQPASRGLFAHVYLNGLYWGLYNLSERPSAPWLAAWFGGLPGDFDSRNAGKLLSGDDQAWQEMMTLANAGLRGEAEFRAIQRFLDLTNFIDYMILNSYGANADWDRASNWYAGRKRTEDGRFRFFIWDAERTLENVEDNSMDADDDQSPSRLFHKLEENAEFRGMFADRVQRHCFNGGALTPREATTRFAARVLEIEKAIVAESARWGDYRRDFHQYKTGPYELYTPKQHWRPEIRRLLTEYFPKRTDVLVRMFRERGLFPQIDAPTGEVTDGGLVLRASATAIFYTPDGSDPRLPGGTLAASAVRYHGPIPLNLRGKLRARALAGEPGSGAWSALVAF